MKYSAKVYDKRGLDSVSAHAAIAGAWTPELHEIVLDLIEATDRLELLPIRERVGAKYEFLSAGPDTKAYRYAVNGIRVTATQTSTGIRIDSITREKRYPKQRKSIVITLSDAQQSSLADRAVIAACLGA